MLPWIIRVALGSMFLFGGFACDSSSGDGDNDENDGGEDAGLPGAPESMWGTYSVRLAGDWVGSGELMISTGAMLSDFQAERDAIEGEWSAGWGGDLHATSVTNDDTTWSFFCEKETMTGVGPDVQVWELIIDERDVDDDGFQGDWSLTTGVIGDFDGTLTGFRE